MGERTDRCDVEVDTHIQHFLDRLPGHLKLERVIGLTLEDPKKALSILQEVRGALLLEQRKAQALFQLSQLQQAVTPKPLPQVQPVAQQYLL